MLLNRRLHGILVLLVALLLTSCGNEGETGTATGSETNDIELQRMVEDAIAAASDLPDGLSVQVRDGVVSISGSLSCPDCGGQRTPGTLGTIQQSIGAVVRAVPGVQDVRFTFVVIDQ